MNYQAQTLFIADLHLKPAEPEILSLALEFLKRIEGAQHLYILGDLFEYWLGDDASDPALDPIHESLRSLSRSGTEIHLMHGNRDFLIGHEYARSINATLHREDTLALRLGQTNCVLLHGDTLCTDDHGYQQLRALVRNPEWQKTFLNSSIEQRVNQAQALRDKSRAAVAEKKAEIMDVNANAVQQCFANENVDCIIHGHTHRPYDHRDDNQENHDEDLQHGPGPQYNSAKASRRLVLGDWHSTHAMIGRFDGSRLVLERFIR